MWKNMYQTFVGNQYRYLTPRYGSQAHSLAAFRYPVIIKEFSKCNERAKLCNKIWRLRNLPFVCSDTKILRGKTSFFESAYVSMRIRIQLFLSMCIQILIQEAKAMAMRIRILVRLQSHKKFIVSVYCTWTILLKFGNRVKNIFTKVHRYTSHFERQETRFICKFWSISMLPNPDLHSQYGSGSRTTKWM